MYGEASDFEMVVPVDPNILNYVKVDYMLMIPYSKKTMIIENIELITNKETGNRLIVSGRSLESILDRRIILQEEAVDNQAFEIIYHVVLRNMIAAPGQPIRDFEDFQWIHNGDMALHQETSRFQANYTFTQYVYDIVVDICRTYGFGFQILQDPITAVWKMMVYAGVDRSYNQTTNEHVVFSHDRDNLASSRFTYSRAQYKTFGLVIGDGSAGARRAQWWAGGAASFSGTKRREMWIDGRDIPVYYGDTTDLIPLSDYMNMMYHRATVVLNA